jgi:hypothetical protein
MNNKRKMKKKFSTLSGRCKSTMKLYRLKSRAWERRHQQHSVAESHGGGDGKWKDAERSAVSSCTPSQRGELCVSGAGWHSIVIFQVMRRRLKITQMMRPGAIRSQLPS